MRKPDLTTLFLAAGAAALAYALARSQGQVAALASECADLYHEGQDERQRAELLTDELALANKEVQHLDDERRSTLAELGRARGEVSRLHGVNRALLDGFSADAVRKAERQQASGWWAWTSPRVSPSGPFGDLDAACDEAEGLARLYAGQDVFLLAAVDRVRVTAPLTTPTWDVDRSPLALAAADD